MADESASIQVYGRVQGVGYRYFAQQTATKAGLTGWVRNRPDGSVECNVEGDKDVINQWLQVLKQGPPLSRVESIHIQWQALSTGCDNFSIRD